MPITSFAVLGADIVGGGNVNTNSNGGSNGQGEVTFSNGSSVFESDDIVVVEVTNATTDGEIGNGSAISDLTVFDSYTDYQAYLASVDAGAPDDTLIKYNYAPQNPGQTATVQSDISGLGDSYARFNANVLQPQDGGPTLNNTLTIAPGTGIAEGSGAITLDRIRDYDLDYDTVIDGGTIEEGNANFFIGDYIEIENGGPVCFVAGTLIATAQGDRLIETLCVGDLVLTQDHGPQPVRWIGHRKTVAKGTHAPVHFAPGAIGNTRPLELSQNHRVLIRDDKAEILFGQSDVFVAAKHLINDQTIRLRRAGLVHYVHILFENHEIVTTDNVQSESLFPDWNAVSEGTDARQDELFTLFPGAFSTQNAVVSRAARPCLRHFEALLLLQRS